VVLADEGEQRMRDLTVLEEPIHEPNPAPDAVRRDWIKRQT
jgi:hypothetical protein